MVGMMFVFHRDVKRLTAMLEQSAEPVAETVDVSAPSRPPVASARPEYVMAASRHTISISSGGVTESRVSRMARSLSTDVGWEGAPVSQAADMRERDGLYDIAFALPRQRDERSVHVSTDGNVLSLIATAIGSPQAKFVRQFYIPCAPAQIGFVETNVSNGVVRIRIHPQSF